MALGANEPLISVAIGRQFPNLLLHKFPKALSKKLAAAAPPSLHTRLNEEFDHRIPACWPDFAIDRCMTMLVVDAFVVSKLPRHEPRTGEYPHVG